MGIPAAFNFDPVTGRFTVITVPDTHPLRPGQYIFPAFSTDIPPPDEVEGFYRAFINGEWQHVPIPPEPEPVVPVDRNILEAPQTLFGGPTLEGAFNGNV